MMKTEYVYKDYVSESYLFMSAIECEITYKQFLYKVMEENMKPTMRDRGKQSLKNIVDKFMNPFGF